MIAFLKRLFSDRRGNALMIAGLSLPLVVGAAGLGTDTVQWVVWKRELQRAADSAAFAGVYAKVQNNANMTASQAVSGDLSKNNHTMVSLLGGYPQVAYPTAAGWTHAVQVTLAVQRPLGFSGLFLSNAPTITATATAALVDHGSYCVVGLAPTGSALIIGGSANVNMGCGAISNSIDPIESVGVNGNGHYFAAEPVAAVGGIDGTINGSPELQPFNIPMEDPYAGLSTDVPAGTPCTNFNAHIDGPMPTGGSGGTATLTPGCYTTFNAGNHTYTLQPGTYYLDNTNLNLNGSTRLVGEGVTIILTGTNPGSVTMNGTSSMDLTAPTTGDYANMVLIQAANATTGNNNTINGDNLTALDGAIYFPSGDVTFTGSTAQAFQCAMVVAYTVEFTGSATVQNNTVGCDADTQVQHKAVRLVA
jgi:Flp pilus assembly protein TadG